MLKEKERLDVALVRLGYFDSRQRAQAAILAGDVMIDGEAATKAGLSVFPQSRITVKNSNAYVSRGGLKLEKALEVFQIDVKGKVVLDVGSSTGGFIDCLLRHGASRVIGVDVGYGQLAWSLRTDSRVTLLERTNIRLLSLRDLPEPVDLITIDVSFISVKKIWPALKYLFKEKAELIILIKPEFEAARGLAKKGVVRDEQIHAAVLKDLWHFFEKEGLSVQGLTYSPITGSKGNIEFLIHLSASELESLSDGVVEKVVSEAHRYFTS